MVKTTEITVCDYPGCDLYSFYLVEDGKVVSTSKVFTCAICTKNFCSKHGSTPGKVIDKYLCYSCTKMILDNLSEEGLLKDGLVNDD